LRRSSDGIAPTTAALAAPRVVALVVLLALAGGACRRVESQPAAHPAAPEMHPPPTKANAPMSASFENVRYGFNQSPCSPRFDKGEPDGIKIAAPPSIQLPAKDDGSVMLPFCVTLRFNSYYITKFDQIFRSVKVVLVDDGNGQVLNGGVWRDRFYRRTALPDIPKEELERSTSTEHLNVNLLEHIRFPPRKATYQVYATLEEHKSNVLTLDVTPE
jgi:hypothetical protein